MCSTIPIPISPKIPKIILRKLSDQFGDFAQGHSAKNWEMWQLLRLIQWRLHVEWVSTRFRAWKSRYKYESVCEPFVGNVHSVGTGK